MNSKCQTLLYNKCEKISSNDYITKYTKRETDDCKN